MEEIEPYAPTELRRVIPENRLDGGTDVEHGVVASEKGDTVGPVLDQGREARFTSCSRRLTARQSVSPTLIGLARSCLVWSAHGFH
jgi:hypothetical protein